MKNIKRLTALAMGIAMTASVFTGCSSNGTTLNNAISKTNKIQYSQVQSDITLNVSATNLSADEQKNVQQVLPFINGSKVSVLTKQYQNADNTVGQADCNFKVTAGPVALDMEVWADVNAAKDKPSINEIVKMPQFLSSYLPKDFQGKDYMVMNFDDMTNTKDAPQIDYKKLTQFSKDFQPKLMKFMADYAKQYNPGVNVINKVTSNAQGDVYELKLDDKTFKQILRYSVKNFAESKDAMAFIKDYTTAMATIVGTAGSNTKVDQKEIDKAFADMQKSMPQMIVEINKSLDALDSVKLIGDKGIKVQYTIDKNGYIVNENGNIELVVDMAKLSKLNGNAADKAQQDLQKLTGVYTIGLNFNNDIKILTSNPVKLPVVNSSNSYKFADLMKAVPETKGQSVVK